MANYKIKDITILAVLAKGNTLITVLSFSVYGAVLVEI